MERIDGMVKAFRRFVISVAVLYLMVSALAIAGFISNRNRAEEGRQAHDYACQQRAFQEETVKSQLKYIIDVKAGRREQIPGVSIADIRQSMRRTQDALNATSFIDC